MMMEGKRRRGRGRGGDGGEMEGRRRGDGGVFMHRQRARDDKHLHELEGETELWMGIRIEEEIKKKDERSEDEATETIETSLFPSSVPLTQNK